MHYWAVENPHWMRQQAIQNYWSLNVLGGVIHNIVVGPFFYEKHLNWEIYARFLREQLEGLEEQLEKLEDVPLNLRQGMFITFCKNYKFNNTIS
jgi:hypothetical protein